MGFIKKAYGFMSRPTRSRTIGIIAMLILVLAIFLTVTVAQQQQIIKQHAKGPGEACFVGAECDDTQCQLGECYGIPNGHCTMVNRPNGTVCGGGTCQNGTCTVTCSRQCAYKQCGPDGCGGQCGYCDGSHTCNDTTGKCEAAGCLVGWECGDGNECHTAECLSRVCVNNNKPNGTACSGGACQGGICGPPQNPCNCPSDNNECTTEACVNNVCTHTNKPSGTACTDEGWNSGTCTSNGICDTTPTSTCSKNGNTCIDSSGSYSGSCSGSSKNIYSCVGTSCQLTDNSSCSPGTCSMSSGTPLCNSSVVSPTPTSYIYPTPTRTPTSTVPRPTTLYPTSPPGNPTPTSVQIPTVTLVSALNARDASLTSDSLSVNLILYNLTTNNQVSGAPATQVFTKTSIPDRQYSANITLTNLSPDKYFIIFRKDNMIAKSVFTVSGSSGTITVPTTTLVFGDINNDNKIDVLDYNMLKSCWTKAATDTCALSDFLNRGGTIDQIDFNTLMRGWATWLKEELGLI